MSVPATFSTPYSPIIERDKEGADDASPRGGGCGCFRRFCCGWDDGGSRNYLLQERHEETWIVAQLNKLKQLSEVVAGPKWKNFIRKMGKLCHRNKQTAVQFQYSPESYALNFVGDQDQEEEEEDGHLSHSFSARFGPRVLSNDHHKLAAFSS